jgi:hypothetical protein
VEIVRSNERLTGRLHAVSRRLRAARAYLAQDGCNSRLGQAYDRYWRTRYSGVLLLLKANRLEAHLLLGRIDPEALKHAPISQPSAGPPSRPAIPTSEHRCSTSATLLSSAVAGLQHLVEQRIDNDY